MKVVLHLLFSSEAKGGIGTQLGTQHYSYRFVEEKFRKMFEGIGLKCQTLDAPETIKHKIAFDALCADEPLVHIGFRSSENFRPVRGIPNICHFAWEFPVLLDRNLVRESPTRNQIRMLGLADEIWVPSLYAVGVLQEYGLKNAVYLPTPIDVGKTSSLRIEREEAQNELAHIAAIPFEFSSGLGPKNMSEVVYRSMTTLGELFDRPRLGGRTFLLICNPGDLRKNILNTVEGFIIGSTKDDILVVKLLVPNTDGFILGALFEHLSPRILGPYCMAASNVYFVFEYLSDAGMRALYSVADFYLSAPHAEGYNLPLLEAMAHGTVPVSNSTTAMADYITADNSILISDSAYPGLIPHMAGDIAGKNYDVFVSSRIDVGCAVRLATELSTSSWREKSAAARNRVVDYHSEAAIAGVAKARLLGLISRQVEIQDL